MVPWCLSIFRCVKTCIASHFDCTSDYKLRRCSKRNLCTSVLMLCIMFMGFSSTISHTGTINTTSRRAKPFYFYYSLILSSSHSSSHMYGSQRGIYIFLQLARLRSTGKQALLLFHTSQFRTPHSGSGGSAVAARNSAERNAAPPMIPCRPTVSPRNTKLRMDAHSGWEAYNVWARVGPTAC